MNFKGYWDDRCRVDGRLHILEIRYFLTDNTIQIIEHNDADGGLKTFLKRQKVPKVLFIRRLQNNNHCVSIFYRVTLLLLFFSRRIEFT